MKKEARRPARFSACSTRPRMPMRSDRRAGVERKPAARRRLGQAETSELRAFIDIADDSARIGAIPDARASRRRSDDQ
jgi:hypothetical protein